LRTIYPSLSRTALYNQASEQRLNIPYRAGRRRQQAVIERLDEEQQQERLAHDIWLEVASNAPDLLLTQDVLMDMRPKSFGAKSRLTERMDEISLRTILPALSARACMARGAIVTCFSNSPAKRAKPLSKWTYSVPSAHLAALAISRVAAPLTPTSAMTLSVAVGRTIIQSNSLLS
jgi:hypothetical protein